MQCPKLGTTCDKNSDCGTSKYCKCNTNDRQCVTVYPVGTSYEGATGNIVIVNKLDKNNALTIKNFKLSEGKFFICDDDDKTPE